MLTRLGIPWTPDMADTDIDWIANEGVRVSRILAHLDSQPLGPHQAELLAQLRQARPPLGPSLPIVQPEQVTGPAQTASGGVTWEIPLRISVDLRGVASAAASPLTAPPAPASPPPVPGVVPAPRAISSEEAEAALRELQQAASRPYHDADADAAAAQAYFADVDDGFDARGLYQALSVLVSTTHRVRPRYKPATQLYPWSTSSPTSSCRASTLARSSSPSKSSWTTCASTRSEPPASTSVWPRSQPC